MVVTVGVAIVVAQILQLNEPGGDQLYETPETDMPISVVLEPDNIVVAVPASTGGPAGSPTVTVAVCVHVLASVIVQVYVPLGNAAAVVEVPPVGNHEYDKVPVPPLAETVADPSLPAHIVAGDAVMLAAIAAG